MQYQHGSSASPCVTGWILTGAVALITSRREVRRRSSFGGRALSPPIRVPLLAAGCGCWLLAAGSWLMAAGSWQLAAGCWQLAAGCWLLAAG